MHRPGADPANMTAQDFLCDFCTQHWRDDRPMVEGHKGSLICADCLAAAYRLLVLDHAGAKVPEHVNCTMCLLHRDVEYFAGLPSALPDRDDPVACRGCIEQAVRTLERDPSSGWKRPG
jgi:hypothetical protein